VCALTESTGYCYFRFISSTLFVIHLILGCHPICSLTSIQCQAYESLELYLHYCYMCSWHGQTKLCITSYMLLVRYTPPGLPRIPCWGRVRDELQIAYCWHMERWEVMSSGSSMTVLCWAIPGIVTMGSTLLVHLAKLPCLTSCHQVFSSVLMVRQESSWNTQVEQLFFMFHKYKPQIMLQRWVIMQAWYL